MSVAIMTPCQKEESVIFARNVISCLATLHQFSTSIASQLKVQKKDPKCREKLKLAHYATVDIERSDHFKRIYENCSKLTEVEIRELGCLMTNDIFFRTQKGGSCLDLFNTQEEKLDKLISTQMGTSVRALNKINC
jgi:hypothetical protein